MRSTFFGLEIGRSSLMVHQKALEVTSQNLANANTPGYSRQNVEIAASDPFTYPGFNRVKTAGQMGTGVEAKAVLRIRDELLDDRVQSETSTLGRWEGRRDMLDQMEQVINEPADSNVRTAVDDFWKYLESLSTNPNEMSIRSAVREQANTMCYTIKQNYTQLKTIRENTNEQIKKEVTQINDLADQIARLNDQISKVIPLGDNPNDLLDKRGELVGKLSKMVGIGHFFDKEGRIFITVGGQELVAGDSVNHIVTDATSDNTGMVKLLWADYSGEPTDKEVKVMNGVLKGWLEIRDRDLPDLMNNLNTYTNTLITKMNEAHRKGYGLTGNTGVDFFQGTDASDIDISDDIKEDLNDIAASKTGAPGNGEIALEMAEIKHQMIFTNNTSTIGDFMASIVSELGVNSETAKTQAENQNLLVNNLDTRRESICGVSYDEEMTNIVRFQHGYDAAAKVISTMDEMLDVIINRLKVS